MAEHPSQSAVSETTSRLAALLAEFKSLDPAQEPARCKELLFEAAPLVDRGADPKKWAAIRFLSAQLCENDDPQAAVDAYRDALSVFREDVDRERWVECNGALGWLLARLHRPATPEGEQAIVHLGNAVADLPFYAELLATLYGWRVLGDPEENWRQRVKYLEIAVEQVPAQEHPEKFARLQNALGLACAEQPGADFDRAIDQRIEHHHAALAVIGEGDEAWVETRLQLGDAYLARVQGSIEENGRLSEAHLRAALAASRERGDREREPRALLLLGRVLMFKQSKVERTHLHDALALFDEARRVVDAQRQPELMSSTDKFTALAQLELIRRGEIDQLEPLVANCEAALLNLDERVFADEGRVLLQIEADALVHCERFEQAKACLERVIAVSETMIAEATSQAGRLDRIWKLRDSAALLSYCCLHLDEIEQAVIALERGKALLWTRLQATGAAAGPHPWQNVVAPGDALLMPLFTAPRGAVIVATRPADKVQLDVVWLPDFGRQRFGALLRGASPSELGGWLHAYCFRHSQASQWHAQIDDIGAVLYDEVWVYVLAKLAERGVRPGTQLVWLPQGGSGVFPMHAAWRTVDGQRRWLVEDFALRYAPSLHGLASADPLSARRDRAALAIVNPTGDLACSALEIAWMRRAMPGTRVLEGAAAHRQAVLAGLPAGGLVHVASHAEFNVDDPFQSCIRLAGDEMLTLAEWLPHLCTGAPALVVLSACETAVTRVTSMSDEMIGFPAALLAHGVRTVLASLWHVGDEATALLIGEFYRQYTARADGAAHALRRAQDWLRTLSAAEIGHLLRDLREEPAPVGPTATTLRTKIKIYDPAMCPFAHPYFWAAFAVWGGEPDA